MKNILFKFIFIVTTILFGILLFFNLCNKRAEKYLKNELMEYLYSNDYENYLKALMVVIDSDEYITKPIAKFEAKSLDYEFNLDVYHYRRKIKDQFEFNLIFNLHSFKINDIESKVNDFEKYESNNDLLGINVRFKNKDDIQIFSQNIGLSKDNKHTNGSSFGPVRFFKDNDNSYFVFSNGKTSIKRNEITSIEFSLADATGKNNDIEVKKEPFAIISNGNNNNSFFNEVSYFDFSNGILVSNDLVSNPSDYDLLFDFYDEEMNITKVSKSVLKKYNSTIYTGMSLYIVAVVIVAFILFFLKPLYKNKAEGVEKQ